MYREKPIWPIVASLSFVVVIASALSLGFLGRLEGVREGTLAAALCVGPMSRLWNRALMEKGCAVFFGAKDAES